LQVHDAVPPAEVVHVWFAPHVCVVTHCVQPFAWVSHVCVAPPEHWVAPSAQVLRQQEAEPGAPEQSPLVHVADDDS
jgi:hypothetical protein